jgi:hypothetical protein
MPDTYPSACSADGPGLGISIPNKDGENGMVPFRRLGLIELRGRHPSVGSAYPWPGLYPLDEAEELVGDGNNDGKEIPWTYT